MARLALARAADKRGVIRNPVETAPDPQT
jgi:hypothetical protein